MCTFFVRFCKFNSFRRMFQSNVLQQRKQKNQREHVFFNKNVFNLNQKHLQVFQTFHFLKNAKKISGDTRKTKLNTSSFCFVFLVSPELNSVQTPWNLHFRYILLFQKTHIFRMSELPQRSKFDMVLFCTFASSTNLVLIVVPIEAGYYLLKTDHFWKFRAFSKKLKLKERF